jgi:hypothetical protein
MHGTPVERLAVLAELRDRSRGHNTQLKRLTTKVLFKQSFPSLCSYASFLVDYIYLMAQVLFSAVNVLPAGVVSRLSSGIQHLSHTHTY